MSSIIGHRGVASLAPENTLAGIHKAAELGLGWIELDVTLLGDGTAVMFHDPTLDRTTNGEGELVNTSSGHVNTLDAGGWFSKHYENEPVPTLLAVLTLIKELGLGLNLELKSNGCNLDQLVNAVVDQLAQSGFPADQLLVSSFSHKALLLFRARSDVRIGCLFEYLSFGWKNKVNKLGAVSVHVSVKFLNEKQVGEIKRLGCEVYCYTINSQHDVLRLKGWKVDGVFSDCPQMLSFG